ncbi:uncharacterized protein LOC115627197 [Scaptodrosophila lebanonensis]|uniref:Uncharacterized protein LOC115627197 n=1 Tax=Drosophila lebanonensis TaxID=7225 RepID=A0A6J2TPT2_DROLE|nr:uncharacterized protein LOC115627197 [Scaptodrosophila lebanonensis]
MNSKVNSLEEKVKLPPTETISRCYQPQQNNRKVIRILTVAVYVLCVSLAAIMLSLYYIFIWDPTIRPFVTKGNHCDKIVIPEKIAIRLLNSSEVTAEQFYKHILDQYRLLNHRQHLLQKQHLQLQHLDATNRFQEIFATATIIQAHPPPRLSDTYNKPLGPPLNSSYRVESPALAPARANNNEATLMNAVPLMLDTSPPIVSSGNMAHLKRKTHRGHNKRHRLRGSNASVAGAAQSHQKKLVSGAVFGASSTPNPLGEQQQQQFSTAIVPHNYMDAPLNPAAGTIVQQPMQLYTSMPIPLILSSSDEKRSSHHAHGEKRSNAQARRRTTTATVSGYDAQTYLNPFLTGELIFEK